MPLCEYVGHPSGAVEEAISAAHDRRAEHRAACCVVADTLPQLQKELRMRITSRAIALEAELLHFVAVTRIDLKEV